MNAFDAYTEASNNAYGQNQQYRQDRAKVMAGRSMQQGDAPDAASALYGAGDLSAGNAMAQYGQQKDIQAATMQGSKALANSDYAGAAKAYGATGDAKSVLAAQGAGQDEATRQLAVTAKLSQAFRADLQQHAGDNPQALAQHAQQLWDQAAPVLHLAGLDPNTQHGQQLRQAFITNPMATLDAVDAETKKAAEPYTLGVDQVRYGANNEVLATGPQAPPKYEKVADGETLLRVGGGGAQPSSAPQGPSIDPRAGIAALTGLGAKITSGVRTPEHNAAVGGVPNSQHLTGQAVDIVPPQNMTMAQLSAHAQAAMPGAKVLNEGDHVHVQWGGTSQSPPLAGGAALAPDVAIVARGAPKNPEWVQKGGVLVNIKTGDRKKDPSAEDVLPPPDPNIVKMIIDGRYPVPTGFQAKDPKWMANIEEATRQDPTLDGANYATRVAARRDFTSGNLSKVITSANQTLGHLDKLDKSIDKMGNTGGFLGSHLLNKGVNAFASQSGDAARYQDFDESRIAVATELTRLFRGSGGAEADVERYLAPLDKANSPQELHAATKAITDLIHSRLMSSTAQYQRSMGKSSDPVSFLTEEAQRAYSRISGGRVAPDTTAPSRSAPAGVIRYDAQGNRVQ